MELTSVSWTAAAAELARTRIGTLVFGSTEQHGPHLPLGTDTFNAWELTRRLALRRPMLVAPVVAFGCSDYHMPWKGTVSISEATMTTILFELAQSLQRHGVDRFLLVNGHGGNRMPGDAAALRIKRELNADVLIVYVQTTAYKAAKGELDLGHGGRIETSLMLAARPDLVHVKAAVGGDDHDEAVRKERRFSARDIYTVQTDWHDVSPVGWFGDAQSSSAEEGSQIFERMCDRIVDEMDKIWAETG